MRPLITVIVPAFNAQATLARTLCSIQAQTHRNLEILVVDDGSSDDTGAIAKHYAAVDRRVQVFEQSNAGVARARNAGLERARGAYVAYVDADDLWHPTKIARQIAVFKSSSEPLSFVYSGYRLIDSEERILSNHRPLTDVSGYTLCRQIATNFFSNVSSIMVPTELAREIGGHDPRLREWGIEGAEDFLFQLRLAMRGPVGCCRAALVGYRMHHANMSRDLRRASRSNLRVLDLVAAEAPQVPSWVFRLGRARIVGYAPLLLRNGDFAGARETLAATLRGQPGSTLAMCARIAVHVAKDELRGPAVRDPEINRSFHGADPDSAVWTAHILLSARQKRRLEAVDRLLAGCQSRVRAEAV